MPGLPLPGVHRGREVSIGGVGPGITVPCRDGVRSPSGATGGSQGVFHARSPGSIQGRSVRLLEGDNLFRR
jgi:hypothetical protein